MKQEYGRKECQKRIRASSRPSKKRRRDMRREVSLSVDIPTHALKCSKAKLYSRRSMSSQQGWKDPRPRSQYACAERQCDFACTSTATFGIGAGGTESRPQRSPRLARQLPMTMLIDMDLTVGRDISTREFRSPASLGI